MSVEFPNPAAEKYYYHWQLVRDCVAGEHTIKMRGEDYLPRKSGQSKEDYARYQARAKWADYTEQALNTMHGMIFRRNPVVEVPDNKQLQECFKNFDCEGHSFYQFTSNACYDNMQTNFGGLLVDMPPVSMPMTVADAENLGIRPFVKYYKAEEVINWKYRDFNGIQQLSKVILREWVESQDTDEFSHELVVQYRVLDLDENNNCRVRIFCKQSPKDKEFNPVAEMHILIHGQNIHYIPFEFLPYIPSKPMLYGVAELNKHYYMQSADYENGVHLTTLPTAVITGYRSDDDVLRLGQDIAIMIPDSDAKAYTLQFAGEGLEHCEKAIESTQEQIGILGTRAVSPDKAMSETSDAAKIHRAGEHAKLATYARDISEVFTRVVQIMADWIGVNGKVSIQFNVDYDTVSFDPNMLNAIANLSREGKFPLPFVYEALVRGEIVPNNFTFGEFMMLIDLEASGVTAGEEVELYQKLRSGEKIEIPHETSVLNLKADISENDKSPDETKQGSLEAGK